MAWAAPYIFNYSMTGELTTVLISLGCSINFQVVSGKVLGNIFFQRKMHFSLIFFFFCNLLNLETSQFGGQYILKEYTSCININYAQSRFIIVFYMKVFPQELFAYAV